MTLRVATASDVEDIMALERASFPTDAWSEAMMTAEVTSPHGVYVVDVDGAALRGYGGVRAVAGASDADIQTIAIAASARGRGRGRALLTHLLTVAADRGAREVFLEVRADNPAAQALYTSEGFLEIARRPHYYQPDDVDAVVMKLDLAGWTAAAASAAASADSDAATGFGTAHAQHPNPVHASESGARTPVADGRGWC